MSATGTRKRLADLGAVASGLAHEIRNPLNSLYINSQILAEMLTALPETTDRKEELLALARANMKVTGRLNDILSEFLRFARPTAIEFVVADLNRVVADTLRFLEVDFARRGIELDSSFHPEPLPLFADEKQLRQVLLNILLNAEEAMDKEQKVIRVTTGSERGQPFVRVTDNGRGIPREVRKQIFQLFFSTRKNGTGLGLPIVRKIVREHGGKIGIRSREGRGTTVTISLPSEARSKARIKLQAEGRSLPEKIR
ncbi:MAG: ATP-binding protein [Thermodesulfobacteriota bacterium]|nr:ATP-binding protein [Thermodesulfobacteriota bacterium]